LLPPGRGVSFNQLPASYLIMIMPFDLWGCGKYRYTFKTQCEEVPGLYLEDGVTRIFLNTRGTDDGEVSPELAELLHYIEDSSDETAQRCRSGRIQKLHRRVREVRASEEFGVKYMQAWEEKIYERMEGKEEGLAEGRKEGREEGRELGEQRISALTRHLLKAGRYDDLERAAQDPACREALCREFGL
ncbi:MAG TPA: hypothetical protein IAC92_08480, partial [Candidatus Ventrisoma faecale]|nr:hypothetical protein [Candidatus Ventrisoma faecale]